MLPWMNVRGSHGRRHDRSSEGGRGEGGRESLQLQRRSCVVHSQRGSGASVQSTSKPVHEGDRARHAASGLSGARNARVRGGQKGEAHAPRGCPLPAGHWSPGARGPCLELSPEAVIALIYSVTLIVWPLRGSQNPSRSGSRGTMSTGRLEDSGCFIRLHPACRVGRL